MAVSYLKAGLFYNPAFTEAQFDCYAENSVNHAAYLCGAALEAFACAADPSISREAQGHHFQVLVSNADALVHYYQLACLDERIDDKAIGCYVTGVFWGVAGAARRYLRLEEDDDCMKHWRSSLQRADYLVSVLTRVARAGTATGEELELMIAALENLCDCASSACAHLMEMVREAYFYPDGRDGNAAGALVTLMLDALEQLRARQRLERAAGKAA